jgi:transposase-like protein
MASKVQKAFVNDLKLVFRATNKSVAAANSFKLSENWGDKYPVVMQRWEQNWEELSAYFEYTEPIGRIIYTFNVVAGFHWQVRKVNKNKRCFHH